MDFLSKASYRRSRSDLCFRSLHCGLPFRIELRKPDHLPPSTTACRAREHFVRLVLQCAVVQRPRLEVRKRNFSQQKQMKNFEI